MSPKNILLVDDHPIVLKGLKIFLESESGLSVSGTATDFSQAIKKIEKQKPDLVVTDIRLDGETSGIELTSYIVDNFQLPVLVFSMFEDIIYVQKSFQAGAKGYLTKKEGEQKLVHAIRKIFSGHMYLSEEFNEVVFNLWNNRPQQNSPISDFSCREMQVFKLVGQGYNSRKISKVLHISNSTVDSYKSKIKQKLNIKNSHELTCHAVRWFEQNSTKDL